MAFTVGWVDLAVINHYLAKADVGLYYLAYQWLTYPHMILMATTAVITPYVMGIRSRGNINAIEIYMSQVVPLWTLAWSICVSLILMMLPFMIPMIFGSAYNESIAPAIILVSGLSVIAFGSIMNPLTMAFDLVPGTMIVNLILTVLNVGGDILLVPRMGVVGAAVATAVSFVVGNILYIPLLRYVPELRSPMVTVKALLFTLPVWVVVVPVVLFENTFGVTLGVMGLILTVFMIRRYFVLECWQVQEFLECVEMPRAVRGGAVWLMRFFSGSSGEVKVPPSVPI
jgi:O-antigen/teichoic acid export membrane protein